ncbi:MAG: acyl-CoA carboxylase subunit beta [Rhodospirillales bacterium]|jgi:acetyl-CoA carboxylase carboxyltransferase component
MTKKPFEDSLNELNNQRTSALQMGGEVKLEKRRNEGHLNARERIDHLFDAGSFNELGMLARSARAAVREKTPADGKVTGFGKVDDRWAGVISNDFTVLGASSALINGKKMRHIKELATKRGSPLVFLGESSGSRMPDRMGAQGRAILGQDPIEYRRLRETPWAAALLGDCYGSSTWYGCMSDFVVMRKGATMAVASSRVTSLAINQPIDKEELGGWKLLTGTSGLVDHAVDTDGEALDAIKTYLSYLPSHHKEAPPVHAVTDGSGADMDAILDLVPEERSKVYDMKKVVAAIVDTDSLFEMKPRYGKSILTALSRVNGHTVGFVANNPKFKGGAIDPDGCNKVISFLVMCDSFNIPIVMLVDVPGFLIGIEGEKRGAPSRIINWMNALSLCTVPKISIILRKSYGQAYLNMGGGRNSDEVAIWPTADLGFMDPKVGVSVLYGIKEEDDPKEFQRRLAEISEDTSAWNLAELYEAQEVLDPRETRSYLIDRLDFHRSRLNGGVGEHLMQTWPTSYP